MTKPNPTIDRLRAVPTLRGLSDRDLAKLAPLVDEVRVETGQTLAREGVSGREAFIVVEGEGDVFIDGERVATVGPGEFIGEMAMLDRQPRCATVRAKTTMLLLVIGPREFPSVLAHPQAAKAIAIQLAQRLRRAESAEASPSRSAR